MKKKIYLLLALMLVCMKSLSEDNIIKNESDKNTSGTEVEISLDNESVT